MQEILDDQLSNIQFSDLKFKGKLYGKEYQRERAADFLKKNSSITVHFTSFSILSDSYRFCNPRYC
jgi:hypothetical protein